MIDVQYKLIIAFPSDHAESMVSSTSKSFLECQKLMSVIICIIIIIIYTQFIFFYFSANTNYIKQPIFTKYVTNSSLFLCIFIAIPLWRRGTKRILLQRISINADQMPIIDDVVTPLASVEDGAGGAAGLLGISENKTDFLTIDQSIKSLLNNNKSCQTLCQRYRVPIRDYFKQFVLLIKYGVLFGFISFSTGILWIQIQNHHANTTTTTAILLDECIFYLITLLIVTLYTYKQQQYKFNSIFITTIFLICIGIISAITYYVYAQISNSSNLDLEQYALCILCGALFGIFISSIDYVARRNFYFHNVSILFGDVLFMIGLYGLVVLICLWPSILIADFLDYEKMTDIGNIEWVDISINTVIDFIFNVSLFLCIGLGDGLCVALNLIICLIMEIIFDIMTNHRDILLFRHNTSISRVDNNAIDFTSFDWTNWECDLLLFGSLLLLIGIISLNTLMIRHKEFSRLYCYQSCYYCCSHTRYYEYKQRHKDSKCLQKCRNICCKCIYITFCFPCCNRCCCCNHGKKDDVQYIKRKERLFYKYGDDAENNMNKGKVFSNMNEINQNTICECFCGCCGFQSTKQYDIVQINPDSKHLSKNIINQMVI